MRLVAGPRTAAAICLATIVTLLHHIYADESASASRGTVPPNSCEEFLPAKKILAAAVVGPDECTIASEEVVTNSRGQKYRRLELRISGAVYGWAATQGPRFNYFNDAPDLVFPQSGNTSPSFKGSGRYSAATGHGMSLFFPETLAQWNGKLFVTAHGAGAYAGVGPILQRRPALNAALLANANRYVGLMLDKGYAVAHTLRSSQQQGGDITVMLDDGRVLSNYNLSSHSGFVRDLTHIATNVLLKHFRRKPRRTYFYGFSAGGFLGRAIQYASGLNRNDEGQRLFDGFLLDDAGGGMWLPTRIVDGKDTLFARDEDKATFVHQIDVTHQLYAGESGDYLQKKRQNARILKEKGLAGKHRMYEIRGISHFDAGETSGPASSRQALDLSALVASLIDLLDRWVEKGRQPPPTKTDDPALGDADGNGVNENAAIALPEIACPLGVYHAYPQALGTTARGGQETVLAVFDGVNLEPFDGRGQFVDMNGNGVRDTRETVAQAWARLRLLQPGEALTQRKYAACMADAAAKLVQQALLPPGMRAYYERMAGATRLIEASRWRQSRQAIGDGGRRALRKILGPGCCLHHDFVASASGDR